MIHDIERISLPSRDTFSRDYVAARRPAIITDLFDGQPISLIKSLDAARAAFGDVMLELRDEYTAASKSATDGTAGSSVSGAAAHPPAHRSFADYLAFVETDPRTTLMCTEYATPARVSAQFTLPPLCRGESLEEDAPEVLGGPRRWGDHDLLSNMFLGNSGNYAHMHYDGDQREVLLYQVFGRKQAILFQPASGSKLDVLNAFWPGNCNIHFEHMTDEQKDEFVDAAGGYQATLEAGEALYMPRLIWHYLEYVDTGMSVNFRFGRNRYSRFLCVDNFHRDYYLQNFAAKMASGDQYPAAIERLKHALAMPAPTRTAKIRHMRRLFKELCIEIAPEAEAQSHCPPEREEQQVALIDKDLQGVRYLPLQASAPALVDGPMTIAQGRAIQGRVRQLAYPAQVLDKVIYNMFAKASVPQLNKIEAALFLRACSSPGAVW